MSPIAGKQSIPPQISSNLQPTRKTAPTTRRQLLADPSRHAAVSFSRRQTSDHPGSELDALAEAAGRLRLEEQAEPTRNASLKAALHQKSRKDTTAKSIEAMVYSIAGEFKRLKAAGQRELKNEAAPGQGSKQVISTVSKQAAVLRRKISIVQGLVGYLGRLNSKLSRYDYVLRKLKQHTADLVEHHQQHDVARREEHERNLHQMMTTLRNLQADLDSMTEGAERELKKSGVKQERLNKRKQ